MWETIIWTFFAAFLGLGFWAMNQTPPIFMLSRVCFLLATLIFLARLSWWIAVENYFGNKLFICALMLGLFGGTSIVLIYGLLWISDQEHKFKETITSQIKAEHREPEADKISLVKQPPKVNIRLYPSPEKLYYKPPLQEYFLSIDIQNPNYVAITDFRMEINFKNVIGEVKSTPMVETGGAVSVGEIRIYSKKLNEPEIRYEEQPIDTSITRAFSLDIQKVKINDKIVNTNIVLFHCEKWPEKVVFSGNIIIDLSKELKVRKKPDKVGTYEGQYFYEINGQKFPQIISGPILSGSDSTKLHEQIFSHIDPQKSSFILKFVNNAWLERDNRFIEIIPYIKRGVFEFHAYRDVDNIFKVLISNTFSKNVILKYGDLDKLKQNPSHPKHIMIVTWGDGRNRLYLDGPLADEYPNK
jgi:hypothetical protein